MPQWSDEFIWALATDKISDLAPTVIPPLSHFDIHKTSPPAGTGDWNTPGVLSWLHLPHYQSPLREASMLKLKQSYATLIASLWGSPRPSCDPSSRTDNAVKNRYNALCTKRSHSTLKAGNGYNAASTGRIHHIEEAWNEANAYWHGHDSKRTKRRNQDDDEDDDGRRRRFFGAQ